MERMRQLITDFPAQTQAAWALLQAAQPGSPLPGFQPAQALVLGMGGSGISGLVASRMLAATAPVPVVSSSDYAIPGWVGPQTLVVACSYSGATEETLSAVRQAADRGARIVAVTSGGTLGAWAAEEAWPVLHIPGGQPPRSQFGFAFYGVMHWLHAFGLVPDALYRELGEVPGHLAYNQTSAEERAQEILEAMDDRNILLYGDTAQEGLLIRWRQQINENGKRLCSHHVFPEMNHNELVGWEGAGPDEVVLVLQFPEDHPRTRIRMEICMDIFQELGADVVIIEPDGPSPMLRFFDLVHVGDWLSLLLAEGSGVDPVDIRNIDRLKDALGQIPQ